MTELELQLILYSLTCTFGEEYAECLFKKLVKNLIL
jgi:hypothetical protein